MRTFILYTVFALAFVCSASDMQAQIGGLINKAKNKAAGLQSNLPNTKTKAPGSGSGSNGSSGSSASNSQPEGEKIKGGEEIRFVLARGFEGYSSGLGNYAVEDLKREGPITAYTHIRKKEEKGNFHFAKDYSELKDIAAPENKNVSIEFSSTPYKEGKGTPTTSFSSSGDHIYARLQVKEGTIREAFKLTGNNVTLFVDYYIYPENSEDIHSTRQQARLFLKAEHIDKQVLDFDIMPEPSQVIPYIDPADRFSYYISQFPFIHNAQVFPKSGKNKIGIRVVAQEKDEWGNITGKYIESMGVFDYNVNVADAGKISQEGQQVQKYLKDEIKYAPKPMPKEWGIASAASVVSGYNIAKYNQLYSAYYKGIKIIKTVLMPAKGATWNVVKDNSNILPAYKYCTQTVYFFVKDAEGRCYYHPCDLRQDYAGGGQYNPIHLAVFGEERVYVNCAEMK